MARKSYNPSGYHIRSRCGITSLPGFVESLRLLMVDEEYTLEDIGQMFGVSRERIRQIAVREGLSAKRGGLHCVRLWDNELHRFRPVHRWVINAMIQAAKTQRWKDELAARFR